MLTFINRQSPNCMKLGLWVFVKSSVDDHWIFMPWRRLSQGEIRGHNPLRRPRGLTLGLLFIGSQGDRLWPVFFHNLPQAHLALLRLGNNSVHWALGAITEYLIVPTHPLIKTRTSFMLMTWNILMDQPGCQSKSATSMPHFLAALHLQIERPERPWCLQQQLR